LSEIAQYISILDDRGLFFALGGDGGRTGGWLLLTEKGRKEGLAVSDWERGKCYVEERFFFAGGGKRGGSGALQQGKGGGRKGTGDWGKD